MFSINDLPNRMHLTGSLAQLRFCVATRPCHDALVRGGINFGTQSVKVLKSLHAHEIYFNERHMKDIHKQMMKLHSELSLTRALPKEQLGKIYAAALNVLAEKYADTASREAGAPFKLASVCLPTGLGGIFPTCQCVNGGAMSFISLVDNQGMQDEY